MEIREQITIKSSDGGTIDLSGDEYRELTDGNAAKPIAPSYEYEGFGIVVVNRAWIYAGQIKHDGTWCVVDGAKNIRRWGTTNGLGQLAKYGPQKETELDEYGLVCIPATSVIFIIDSDSSLWK